MRIFKRLENLFESAVEEPSSALFRQPLTLKQVEDRLTEAMLENSLSSNHGRMAPDTYSVRLAPTSYEATVQRVPGIARHCEEHLRRVAVEKGVYFDNPRISFTFLADDNVGRNKIEVATQFTEKTPMRPEPSAQWDDAGTRVINQGEWFLEVLDGPLASRVFPIPVGTTTVGRGDGNDIVVTDARKTVSRQHAALERHGDQIAIRDLGSSNGIKVNGISAPYSSVTHDTRIALGECNVRIVRRGRS